MQLKYAGKYGIVQKVFPGSVGLGLALDKEADQQRLFVRQHFANLDKE
jgi:hypothetical protein